MNTSIKIYPGPDSSTWPAKGSLWHWVRRPPARMLVAGHFEAINIPYESIVFVVEVVYCTKSEMTVRFIAGEKVYVWTFPCSAWNSFFEKAEVR